MAFLGIDVGSGSVRAGIFDKNGKQLAMSVFAIEQNRPKRDFVEQSSDNIWQMTGNAIKSALKDSGLKKEEIEGIGIDATCSLVALDKDDMPVSVSPSLDAHWNIIMWMDHRALAETDEINATKHEVLKYVGGSVSPEMEIPKILWLKRNMPDSYKNAFRLIDLADFLVYKACGEDVRSVCTTSCKWNYLSHENRWAEDFFSKVGLEDLVDTAKVGTRIEQLGEKAGVLSDSAAQALGLCEGTPVAVGIIDAHAGGLALLSAMDDTTLAIIGGTSSCHMAVSTEPSFVPGVWGPYFGAMLPGKWLNEGGQSATGALLDNMLHDSGSFAELKEKAAASELSIYDVINSRVTELLEQDAEMTKDFHILPYFNGNRSPRADATLKGSVVGLTLETGLDALAKRYLATIEAIACGTRHIIETMNANGYSIDEIAMCGGGTKNPIWLQVHADVTGLPIVLPKEPEAVLLGSAILGASISTTFSSIADAASSMTGVGKTIEPQSSNKRFYDKKYKVFLEMYEDQQKYQELMSL